MRSERKPESVFFVGVTGGICAGKSAFAERLRQELGLEYCRIICEDFYYRDHIVDFTDPSAIDFALLYQHLLQLQRGEPVRLPIYDFAARRRLFETMKMYPADVILVEGALFLTQSKITDLLTESVFLDTPEPIRLERRLMRETVLGGRTRDDVLGEFRERIKPVHNQCIESAKSLATYCIYEDETAREAIADLVDKLGIDS